MTLRRAAAALAAATMVMAGGMLIAAPSASAATVDLTIDCNSDAVLNAAVGDTVVIHMTAACAYNEGWVWNGNGYWPEFDPSTATGSGFFGPAVIQNSPSSWADWLYADDWGGYSDGAGTTTFTTTLRGTDGAGNPLRRGSIVAVTGPNGFAPYAIFYQGSPAGNATPMWDQGYGRASADAACEDGWYPSWAQWPNDGNGGWVCTRGVPMYGSE